MVTSNGESRSAAAAPRKKKITRLVPPEEALAPIEEVTDRSEECHVISESLASPYRPSGRPGRIRDVVSETSRPSSKKGSNQQSRMPTPQPGNILASDMTGTSRNSPPKTTLSKLNEHACLSTPAVTLSPGSEKQSRTSLEMRPSASDIVGESADDLLVPDVVKRTAGVDEESSFLEDPDVCELASQRAETNESVAISRPGTTSTDTATARSASQAAPVALHFSDNQPFGDNEAALSDFNRTYSARSSIHQVSRITKADVEMPTDAPAHHAPTEQVSMQSIDSFDGSSTKELEADFSSLLGDSTGLNSVQDESDNDAMFNFDDDNAEQNADDQEEQLTWRLDPSMSLSDWAIITCNKKNGFSKTYHVHKNMLAVGPRKGEYFVKAFRNLAKASAQDSTAWPLSCEIELEDLGDRAFPDFLDFVYSPDGSLNIKTETAVGLRYLANFFGVRALHTSVMDFILKDLTLATMHTYYNDLHALRDEKLLANAAKYCAKNLMKIETDFPTLKDWDPSFVLQIMQSSYIDSKARRLHLSLILAEYCRTRKEKLHAREFAMLTDDSVLPMVHYNAALTLMEMESDIVVATSLKSMIDRSSLQKRCIKQLSVHWKELCDMDESFVSRVCRKLPCSAVADLMMKSLSIAKRRSHSDLSRDGQSVSDGVVGKLRKGKNPIDPAAVKLKRENDATVDDLKRQYDEKIEQLQKENGEMVYALHEIIAQKDRQLSQYVQEFRNFERLPNSYEGKLLPTGRSHKPSLVPEMARDTIEGMLLVSKKSGIKHPVYYYKQEEPDQSHTNERCRKEQKP